MGIDALPTWMICDSLPASDFHTLVKSCSCKTLYVHACTWSLHVQPYKAPHSFINGAVISRNVKPLARSYAMMLTLLKHLQLLYSSKNVTASCTLYHLHPALSELHSCTIQFHRSSIWRLGVTALLKKLLAMTGHAPGTALDC